MKQSENNNNNAQESRIEKLFHDIKSAFRFARKNKSKSPKVRNTIGTNDYYVSYLLNANLED